MICEKEGVKFEEKALEQIYDATSGDLRHSINILQAGSGNGICIPCQCNFINRTFWQTKVRDVIRLALMGKFNDARLKLLELTHVYGMSESDFLKYANQEAYDMKLDRPDEFGSTNGRI